MKQLLYIIAITFAIVIPREMCRADDERDEHPQFKGIELYSWEDQGEWVFTLAGGTNRLKIEDEIKDAKDQIKDIEALKKALARLAVREYVFWHHSIKGFEFPPEAIIEEIEKAAEEAEIRLHIAPRKKDLAAEPDASPERGDEAGRPPALSAEDEEISELCCSPERQEVYRHADLANTVEQANRALGQTGARL